MTWYKDIALYGSSDQMEASSRLSSENHDDDDVECCSATTTTTTTHPLLSALTPSLPPFTNRYPRQSSIVIQSNRVFSRPPIPSKVCIRHARTPAQQVGFDFHKRPLSFLHVSLPEKNKWCFVSVSLSYLTLPYSSSSNNSRPTVNELKQT